MPKSIQWCFNEFAFSIEFNENCLICNGHSSCLDFVIQLSGMPIFSENEHIVQPFPISHFSVLLKCSLEEKLFLLKIVFLPLQIFLMKSVNMNTVQKNYQRDQHLLFPIVTKNFNCQTTDDKFLEIPLNLSPLMYNKV